MRAHLGAEAVLERRDDPPAVGVVLRVGRRDEQDVQRQPQRVAANLDVALLHHVEQRDLDPLGEVGQLVDGHDAPVGAGHEAVVDGLGVAERTPFGDLDGVDVADEVGHGGVGGGELLGVALVAAPPRHRQVVAQLGGAPPGGRGDRGVGVLAELGARDDRGPLVEQADERAQQPGLALAALAEQHDVVAREQGPLQLGEHGALEADDARPRVAPRLQRGDQVVADLVLDATLDVAGRAERAQGAGKLVRHPSHATPGRGERPVAGIRRERRGWRCGRASSRPPGARPGRRRAGRRDRTRRATSPRRPRAAGLRRWRRWRRARWRRARRGAATRARPGAR